MNKYQEALSSILFTLHLRVKPKILGNCEDENLEVLQELVDRATPQKVIFTEHDITTLTDQFRIITRWNNCPVCSANVKGNYCHNCGKKLDWSEE